MSRIAVLTAIAIPVILCAAAPLAACNPQDCGNSGGKGRLSAEELKRDREITRNLNRDELRYVTRRDANNARQRERDAQALSTYERERAEYDLRMAQWREAVRRCRAGDWRYCDR